MVEQEGEDGGKKPAFDSIGTSLTGETMDEQLQLTFCSDKRVTSEVFNLKTLGMQFHKKHASFMYINQTMHITFHK